MLKSAILKNITAAVVSLSKYHRAVSYYLGMLLRNATLLLLKVYRCCISPLSPGRCRFYPSCSQYAEQLIKTHKLPYYKVLGLVVGRILKCHPLHPGGVDLPPEE